MTGLVQLTSVPILIFTHHEVELLGLLLIGPPLGNAGFAQVCLRHSRLDRFSGAAVVETLRHVVVFNSYHVLDGGQGGLRCLFDLCRRIRVR